jgi:xylulokinase
MPLGNSRNKDALSLAIGMSTQSVTWQVSHPSRGPLDSGSIRYLDAFPQISGMGFMDCLTGDVLAPPMLFVAALDEVFKCVAASRNFDITNIKRLTGDAQQHMTVYLNGTFEQTLSQLDSGKSLAEQLRNIFSLPWGLIWMNNSTDVTTYAELLPGGAARFCDITGSLPTKRFFGPAISLVASKCSGYWEDTDSVTLLCGFCASICCSKPAPLEQGDAAGGNLMDIRKREWSDEILSALDPLVPNLSKKLPRIVDSDQLLGPISPYLQTRFGFSEDCLVLPWTGDNPASLPGLGITTREQGIRMLSKGTSITECCLLPSAVYCDPSGAGSVFGALTRAANGEPQNMAINTFKTGGLVLDSLRQSCGLSWDEVEKTIAETPPGNNGQGMIGLFQPEISPRTERPHIRYYGGLRPGEAPSELRALAEFMALQRWYYSFWMGPSPQGYLATGGGAKSRVLLQIDADVSGAEIHVIGECAATVNGGCLRGLHSLGHSYEELLPIHCPRRGEPIRPKNVAAYDKLKSNFASEMQAALNN